MRTSAFVAAALSAMPFLARAATTPEQAIAFRDALTEVDKINVLQDEDFVFDFTDKSLKKVTGAGGSLIAATEGNFAALVNNGLALVLGMIEPCGINTPHTHPRATEMLLVTSGQLTVGFIEENGSRVVLNNVTEYSAAVFPKGSIHFQANYECAPVTFVAALSDPDPGTSQIAQRVFNLPQDVLAATLGGVNVKDLQGIGSMIPDSPAAGSAECYKRCGIAFPSPQPTLEQQPPKSTGTTSGETSTMSTVTADSATTSDSWTGTYTSSGSSATTYVRH